MSVYIGKSDYQNNHNNFSQHLPATEKVLKLPQIGLSHKRMFSLAKLWIARTKQRNDLAKLDENQLNDIGLSVTQAHEE